MAINVDVLVNALTSRMQVTLTYQKKTTGEVVTHTGGIYEIGVNKAGNPCLWLWDTSKNDHIRDFLLSNIVSCIPLQIPFQPDPQFPLKLNGEIIQ